MSKLLAFVIPVCAVLFVTACSSPPKTAEEARSLSGPELVSYYNQTVNKSGSDAFNINYAVSKVIAKRGGVLDQIIRYQGLPCYRGRGCVPTSYGLDTMANTRFNRDLLEAGAWLYVSKSAQTQDGAWTTTRYTVKDKAGFKALVRKVMRH